MNWLRLHTNVLESRKIQALSPELFRAWVNLLCVSRLFNGILPEDDEIAFRLRCSTEEAAEIISQLTGKRLVEVTETGERIMHDWDEHQYASDSSAERMRRHRERHKPSHVTSPLRHTDRHSDGAEQNRTEQNRTEQRESGTLTRLQPVPKGLPDPGCQDFSVRFDRLYVAHPKTGFEFEARSRYAEIVTSAVMPDATADLIDISHRTWLEFWRKNPAEFVPSLSKWFEDKYYVKKPMARDPPKRRKSIDEIVEEMNAEDRANL